MFSMLINKYYFKYRGSTFLIFGKDISDAFIPWKRMMVNSSLTQADFEKDLIQEEPKETVDYLILTSDALSREETLNIINKGISKKNFKAVVIQEKLTEKDLKSIVSNVEETQKISKELD